jgi:hypothetical protein
LDYFSNVCTSSDCQAAWVEVSYLLSCADASTNEALMWRVASAHEVTAHCPAWGVWCDSDSIQTAVESYDDDCGCADLDYYLGNATAYAEAVASDAFDVAWKKCSDGVCDALSGSSCYAAQTNLYECAYPVSVVFPLQASIGLPIIQSCANVANPCDAAAVGVLFGDFAAQCGADAATQHGNLCDMSNSQCQKATNALYACSSFVTDFESAAAIGSIAQSQENCMIPDWTPESCSPASVQAALTTFMTACDKCMPNGDMPACSTQLCAAPAGSACANGYAALAACFLQIDEGALANIVNTITPLGAYCDVTAAECTDLTVGVALQNVQSVCGCTNAVDCLAKADDCSLLANPACAMAAQDLLISCGPFASTLSADIQQIFTQAGPALAKCSQPTCDAPKYLLTGPFQVDGAVECCNLKTGKGAHGLDGGCCLRNPKQSDVNQPNAYTDPTNKDANCCYVPLSGDRKGTCPTSGASSTAAGVATLIATAAALLL